MPLDHFVEMERRLLIANNLNPRVRAVIMNVVTAHLDRLQQTRLGQSPLTSGSVSQLPTQISAHVRSQFMSEGGAQASLGKVAGLMTVVADGSVLFTTRDWGVAGTISTMAGALVAVVSD